jgi:gliding motility-associated-like protein
LTDNNNCSVALSQTITQPAVLTVSSKTENPVSCFGSNTGSANIAVSGGTRPYQYSWSPNVSTDSFANNLAAGTYIITIRDTNLCSIIDSFIITSPPRLTAQYVVTQIGCFGDSTGAITVTPSGGTPNYSYSWTPFTLSDSIVTGLSQGNYSLTIYDGRQCSIDTSFVITQPTAITATLTHKDVSCFGANDGSLTLTVSGGTTPYSFLGNPVPSGTTTVPNLAPNTYAGNLTDNNNCSVALSQTILEPTALTVVSKTAIDVACFGDNNGSASIQIGGGKQPYSYSWSPNVSTDSFATGLQNGTYVVTARDSNLCSITDSIIIRSQPQLFALVITSQVNCFGGSDGAIRVTPNGGSGSYNLTWNPASYTGDSLANLSAGTYTLTVTDDSLCVFDTSIVISQPSAALSFTQKDSTNVNCFGGNDGKIITKVSGGTASYTYTWMPNVSSSDSATNLTAGVYGLTVTDANNCSIATSIEITEPSSALAIDSITKTDVRCNGGNNGSATVFVSGGTTSYTYTWTPNAGAGSNVSNLTAGGYAILVTDNNGCTVTSSVSISEPSQITSTSTKTDVNCNGASDGTISINTTGGTPSVSGYRYTWNPNVSDSSTAINLSAGNYAITVSDSLLCTTTVAVTISEPASMILNGVVLNATCYLGTDGRITVTATGGASPYSYQISSDNGVTFTNNANNVFTNLTNQSYIVRVSDANSCSIDQTYVVTAPVAITAQFVTDSVSCFGDSDGSVRVINTIGGNGGYIYQLAAITNSSGVFTNLGSGTYPLVITDSKNCTVTFNPVVGEPEELLLDITANPSSAYQDSIVIKLGDIVQLNANTNYSNVVFQWTPSMGLSCDDCDDPLLATNYSIKYTVKATVIPVRKECIATKSLAVTVLKDYQLYIPNSFTPNGDGVNDMYEIFGNKAIIKFWSFDLYNRWGEKVFESNDINFQWDGRYKGVPVSQGVYVYHLNVVFIDNHKETDLRGSITILK